MARLEELKDEAMVCDRDIRDSVLDRAIEIDYLISVALPQWIDLVEKENAIVQPQDRSSRSARKNRDE